MDVCCSVASVSHSHSPAINKEGIARSCTILPQQKQKKVFASSPDRRGRHFLLCAGGNIKHRLLGRDHARSAASPTRIHAIVDDAAAEFSSAPVEITWQIAVGALAGIMPFIVAGIEFSKRIVAQRKCEACKGSGLVLKDADAYYVRCPSCGGFLPWQSWKRFFTG